jgi:hypothetical protein
MGPPPPLVQQINFEIIVLGTMATGGSSVTPAINVFNFRRTSNPAAPYAKGQINTAFQAAIMAPLLAASNVRYTPTALTIRCINDALDAPVQFTVAGVGAIATDSLPSDDCITFILKTGLRGGSYRGAKHFAGGSEVDTTNDLLTGAGLARWQAVRTALLAGFTDAGANTFLLEVVSRLPANSQLRANPTTVLSTLVTSITVDANIGTMRRRRSKTVKT